MITKLSHGPSVPVQKINELIDAVNDLKARYGDGFVQTRNTSRGGAIGLLLNQVIPRIPRSGGGGGSLRIAYCSEDAQDDNVIEAELDEIGGDAIEVTCTIAQAGTALDEASPRLIDEDPIIVSCVDGEWRCMTTFMPTDDCVCVEDTP